MTERILVLVAAVVVAAVVLRLVERRSPARLRVEPGITVYTGPACRLCPVVLDALDDAGVSYRVVDASTVGAPVRSVPTVVVGDERGTVTIRRSGRAAITDLPAVLAIYAQGWA